LATSHQNKDGRPSEPFRFADDQLEVWLKNSTEEKSRVHGLLDDFALRHQLSPDILHIIQVVLEEHLTNIISYAYEDREEHQIHLRVGRRENMLELQIVDDGKPFNPLDLPLPDTRLPLEKKPLGGLGILMIRKMMDQVAYTRLGNKNVLTLRKQISVKE
jgi:anti-sigma regulatory factor (Ser/Thr protein kinase)